MAIKINWKLLRFSLGVTGVTDRRPLICQQHTANYIQQGGNDGRTRFFFSSFSLSLFRFVLTQHLIERLPNFNKQKIRKKKKRSSSGSTRRRCRESERESKYTPCGKQEEKERKHAATAAAAAHGILFYFVFFLSFSPVLQDARKLRDDTLTLDAACSTRFRETTKEQQSTIPIF